MKYIVVLGDGMADYKVPELGGRTPLEAADKPYMDTLAKKSVVGMAQTIPLGMPPGSDAANMSVMGFAPARYYSGRSPLEAVAMGIELGSHDVTYRTNLVTLSDEAEFSSRSMLDYSAGEITSDEARQLIEALQPLFAANGLELHAGISYRHCAVRRNSETGALLTPPHDISGKPISVHLPKGSYGVELTALMAEASSILQAHPVNQARIAAGRHPANSVWFWGEGTRPSFAAFEELYGRKAGVVCAVDLIRGLGLCAGMRVRTPKGATGIIAFKLTEVSLFNEELGKNPILLLDDIFSELDIKKRNQIIKNIPNNIQTIITTTDLKNIQKRVLKDAKVFIVDKGKVTEKVG